MDTSRVGTSAATAATKSVDAIVIYNNKDENAVKDIVKQFKSFEISTHFFNDDIRFGDPIDEYNQLRAALIVVVFLGQHGWGPTHLKLTQDAQKLEKDIIPVLLDHSPEEALDSADGLFRKRRRVDLGGANTISDLVQEILRRKEVITDKAYENLRGEGPIPILDEFIDRLLESQSPRISAATPIARKILFDAAGINPSSTGTAQISTTRLLIAAFDVGTRIADIARDDDRLGVLALQHVLATNDKFSGFVEFRSRYVKRQSPDMSIRSVVGSDNVRKILDSAAPAGELTADSLVAALLSQPGTKVETRLSEAGVHMRELRAEVLTALQGMDSSRIDYWKSVFPVDQPGPAPVVTITFARMGNDNPERDNLDDKLGVADEARAFARVAAARQVDPPLAFGIFGDWGSGKSFFMRLMQDYVEKLSHKLVPEAATELFHENIVQIRFNAWHYAETNLWASLVDYIFSELDRWIQAKFNSVEQNALFDKLTTARELTIDSAEQLIRRRKEQKSAAERVAAAERELAAANEKAGVTPKLFWQVVREKFTSSVSENDIKQVAATLGLDQLASDAEVLKKTIDGLAIEGQRTKIVAHGIWRRLYSAPSCIFILIALVVVPGLLTWLRDWILAQPASRLTDFVHHINAAVLAATGVLASLATVVGIATNSVKSAVAKLEGFRADLDGIIAEQVNKPTDEVKIAQDKLAKLTADVAEAHALLENTSNHLADAAREYASGTGRGRLLSFVRERASQGEYAKHLGLIATVRKDFTDLSAMMSKVDPSVQEEVKRRTESYNRRVQGLIAVANEEGLLTSDDIDRLLRSAVAAQTMSQPIFQRIILYIDDLDRCQPEKVVDVLQAVHLLLTFPLFVVVVAVDARWVGRSLETQYEHLLGQKGTDVTSPGATARDYLEKIFQVPYWVRPMTADSSRNLLMSLVTVPSVVTAPVGADNIRPTDGPTAPANAIPVPPVQVTPGDGVRPDVQPRTNTEPLQQQVGNIVPTTVPKPPVENGEKPTPQVAARALELTNGEQAFMKYLAPHLGSTPRSTLRFLNVYRVIKASLNTDELAKLEKAGGYRGLMAQLAITTGSPALQKRWTELLSSVSQSDGRKKIEDRLKAEPWFQNSDGRRLKAILSAFWAKAQNSDPKLSESTEAVDKAQFEGIGDLQRYGEIAWRYSFSV